MVLATLIFCLASNPASCPVRKQFRVERVTGTIAAGAAAEGAADGAGPAVSPEKPARAPSTP